MALPPFARRIQRLANGARKFLAGLTPHGENVWPGVHNDLFLAHLSIYRFFAGYAQGKRVLDAGCGAGYGSAHLVDHGAAGVLGIDIDPRNIRYARRHYRDSRLRFEIADCERLSLEAASLDLIVASNVVEHLRDPRRFLQAASRALVPSGMLLIALPPIVTVEQLSENNAIPYHRSNLYVDEWLELFGSEGFQVTLFRQHWSENGAEPDFSSPFPSRLTPETFTFAVTSREELYRRPSIGAIYVLNSGGTPHDTNVGSAHASGGTLAEPRRGSGL